MRYGLDRRFLRRYAPARRFSARAGMTLLELAIAAGTTAVILAGSLQIFTHALWQTESAAGLNTSMSEAHAMLEEIRAVPFNDVLPRYGPQGTERTFAPRSPDINGLGSVHIDASNPDLLEVRVVVCWLEGTQRVMGEDANSNGVLDPGEDANGNGRLDSPASVTALIARR